MKRLSHAKMRDANEPDIVRALKKVGATVVRLDTPFDLLVGKWGRWHALEVKNPDGKDRLTLKQKADFERFEGTVHVVRSPEEALKAIGQPPAQAPEPPKPRKRKPKEEVVVSEKLT